MKYPEHLGITALQKYEECPRCFWFEYIAGLKDKPSPAMVLGSTIHNAIRDYHLGSTSMIRSNEVTKLLLVYTEVVPQDLIESPEVWFDIPFVNVATGEYLPFNLAGYIDGIGKEWIFEHKTSSQYWKIDDVETNIQATAYAYAYYIRTRKLPKGIRFQILKKNKVRPKIQFLETYRTLEDFLYLWNWAKGLVDRMELDDFEPKQTRFGFHHFLCSYYTGG